jgi:hypothetical protein
MSLDNGIFSPLNVERKSFLFIDFETYGVKEINGEGKNQHRREERKREEEIIKRRKVWKKWMIGDV